MALDPHRQFFFLRLILTSYEGFVRRLLTGINVGVATTPPGLGYPKIPRQIQFRRVFVRVQTGSAPGYNMNFYLWDP